MKLENIGATNLMGASFALPLSELNLIVGPIRSGKSRVRRAIELALLGYVPGFDKTARDIFRLASGRKMEVQVEIATEPIKTPGSVDTTYQVIHRSWELQGETVKVKHHVPLGLDGKMPLVMLDAGDYFNRSARGRVELVFATAKIDSHKAIRSVLAEMPDRMTVDEIYQKTKPQNAQSTQDWLELALSYVEAERSEAAANVRRYHGTVQGLSALGLEDTAPQRETKVIDRELWEAREAVWALERSKEGAETARWEQEERQAEIGELKHRIAHAGDPIPREWDVAAMREKEKTLSEKLVELCVKDHNRRAWENRKRTFEVMAKCPTCGRPWDNKREFTEPEPPNVTLEHDTVEAEHREVVGQLDEHARTEKVREWRRELARLEETPGAVTLDPKAIAADIAAKREQIAKLEAERKLAESDRNDRKRLAEARRESEKAQEDEERYKAAKKFLLEQKEKLIAEVFGPLLGTANRIGEGILPYIRYDGEFGYFVAQTADHLGRWVSADTFSGAETALLYLSLQIALGAGSPCRIAVVDELGRMDDRAMTLFLINVAALQQAGVIEQFVGLTPRMPENLDTVRGLGFQIIESRGSSYSTT